MSQLSLARDVTVSVSVTVAFRNISNGLSPDRHQAIIRTNGDIVSIRKLDTLESLWQLSLNI